MQLRHDTFARAGGYTCINPLCEESPRFIYKNPRGKVFSAAFKAQKVKVGLGL